MAFYLPRWGSSSPGVPLPASLCPQALPASFPPTVIRLPLPQGSWPLLGTRPRLFHAGGSTLFPTHEPLTAQPLDPLCSWAWAADTETQGEGGDSLFHGTGCCLQGASQGHCGLNEFLLPSLACLHQEVLEPRKLAGSPFPAWG